ncbi:MAG: rRNA maturation RNase YbeY [Alphaproteobacteria bacterium]|nr:rRNA maturation RNase YbeY [Alphaproteobacteria bacterium]
MAMNNPVINISVNDERWEETLPNADILCFNLLQTALRFINKFDPSDLFTINKPMSLNLCLSNDEEVHYLNKEFRNKDKPTNVLSFANIDDPEFDLSYINDVLELGDIIISLETMQTEASQKNISFEHHFSHLLVHGILHLLGYDHIEDDEADFMEDLETKILNILNIPNPYQE